MAGHAVDKPSPHYYRKGLKDMEYGNSDTVATKMKYLYVCLAFIGACGAETVVHGRRSVVLSGQAAQVTVDMAGGSIVDFHLQNGGLNPLQWEERGGATSPRPMG